MKQCRNPQNSKTANTNQRNQHWHNRIAHAAQYAYHNIHSATKRIGRRYNSHPAHTCCNHRAAGRVYPQKKRCKCQFQKACNQTYSDGAHLASCQNLVDSADSPCSHILTGKRNRRLIKSIHREINKILHVAGRRVSCHDSRAKRIYGGLNHHVGQGENHPLYARRKSNFYNSNQLVSMNV